MTAAVGATLPLWEKRAPPESVLWRCVVARVWLDFTSPLTALGTTDRTRLPGSIRGEAIRWLTWPEHLDDRQTVCDLAGIEESMLRRAARARLKQMKQAEAENRQVTVISLDAMFARLLEREADGADPGELTRELEKLALAELAA